MLQKALDFCTPKYVQLKDRIVFVLLFVITLGIRLPFFFRDYIDRDESTFILIGQSWVDGHLPFTTLWDVKPPLTFFFFAAIIYVFGKSLLAIRFFGVLMVVTSSFFTYKIGSNMASKKIGFWGAIFSVVLQSLFGSLQGVMSEHICMAFFMAGLYILVKYKTLFSYFMAGILLGISVMVKLNMAYALLFLGLYIFYFHAIKQKQIVFSIKATVVYGTGILVIIGIVIFPYYRIEALPLWWGSVVEAPLDYAAARRYSPLKLTPLYVILVGFLFFAWKKKHIDFGNWKMQLLLVAILGVLVSFYKGGRINGHYLIQLHPILIIIVASVIANIAWLKKINYRPLVFFLLPLIPMESYLEYYDVAQNKINKGQFFNGEGIDVPLYIKEHQLDTKNILFLEYHIGYWMLGVNPPTKAATHPSNICKAEMFPYFDNPRKTALEEIRFILEDLEPKTIVVRKGKSIFDVKLLHENEFINAYLEKHYKVLTTIDRAQIYQRL